MRPSHAVLLAGVLVLGGCSGTEDVPPDRPEKPVVEWVTVRVPGMT